MDFSTYKVPTTWTLQASKRTYRLDIPGPTSDEKQFPQQGVPLGEGRRWIQAAFGSTVLSQAFKSNDGCPVLNKYASPSFPGVLAELELAPTLDFTVVWGHFYSLEKSLTAPSSIKT